MTTIRPLALAAALLLAQPAAASTFDIFGYTARDVAMGSAMTAAAEGYSAIYYNPAALTTRRARRIGLGLTLTLPDLYVERARTASRSPDGQGHPTVLPENHLGLSLGWNKPVGGIFDEKVVIGVGLYVPLARLLRVQGVDPQSPQFYLYQNLQDKLVIGAAIAYEPVHWLSLGLGVQILADLAGSATLQLDIANSTFAGRRLRVTVDPTAGLLAGLHVRPTPDLWFGFSYRGSTALDFTLPVKVTEGQALALDLQVHQTVLWSPHQLSLGAAWAVPTTRLRLALDATLALWSDAPDPSPRLVVDIGGRLLDAFGLEDALDLSANTSPIDLAFVDTVTIRAGAEWIAADWLALRAGYFFRPTPAPRQTGATAYVDNDAHVLSLGAGFALLSPFQDERDPTGQLTSSRGPVGSTLLIDVAAQLALLSRRAILRTDPDDPIGSFAHGGAVWGLQLNVTHGY